MKYSKKIILAGILLGFASAAALATGAQAAETVTESSSQIIDAVKSVVGFLPFPWNAVGLAVISAAGAVWAWRKTKKKG